MFEAYALGDDSDWTWLASTQPVSVEATAHWVLGKVLDDDLGALCRYRSAHRKGGRAGQLYGDRTLPRARLRSATSPRSRRMKGTRVGTEAVWLLLKNAFEHQYRRLEWKCDSMNIASRNAAERLGFVWEGRLRQKLVRKGRNRDSDMLSIIDGEWPEKDAALRAPAGSGEF
ncbi:GNAT family N-acetyltransferase [Enterobacter hormaechei]|nr:GNAT family N-acetyltransferase [Enterobacter hormaechei]